MSLLKQFLLSLIIVGAAAALWSEREQVAARLGVAAEEGPAPTRATREITDAVPVIVAPVVEASDSIPLEAVGTGRARHSILLRPEVTGKVVEMALSAGARFSAGDTLLRLDDANEVLALSLAETRLAEAERVSARFQRLRGSGATSTAIVSEAQTATAVARIEWEQAAQALRKRTLRAPFDGVAGLPSVNIGDWVEDETVVASFDDRAEILVEVDIPEAYLARLEPDMIAEVRTPAFSDRAFQGRIAEVDSRVDPVTRSLRVHIAVPNADDRLRPGASFTVRLDLPGGTYRAVPELALQFEQGGTYVWRVTDNVANRVPVRLVRRRSPTVLVAGALMPEDLVVVEGVQRLRPGRETQILEIQPGSTMPKREPLLAGQPAGAAAAATPPEPVEERTDRRRDGG